MKIDFKDISERHINTNRVFYLYGNYKKTFNVFCDFFCEQLRKKFSEIEMHFCSVVECVKIINGQCGLFDTKINCFFIRNIEDSHLEKLSALFNEDNNFFILESGDYAKSKKITDHFSGRRDVFALASFKNDLTVQSICKLLLPKFSQTIRNEVVKIINETDEDLSSLFKKISLLQDDNFMDSLQKYFTHKHFFLDGLDFIPLIRHLLQISIKDKIFDKPSNYFKTKNKELTSFLLSAEIKRKHSYEINKSYIYQELLFNEK